MSSEDLLQPFLFEHVNIRGYIVNLTKSYQIIIEQRPYPAAVKQLLGEAMISAVFLAASMKSEGRLSLQFHGNDRLPLLVVQCDQQLSLRATAKYEKNLSNEEYLSAFLNGKLSLTFHSENQSNGYQSIIPIASKSISENFMRYLTQSEQIPNQVWLATSEKQVAGLMLQEMPANNPEQQEQVWNYALAVGQTLSAQELLTLDNKIVLHRLFHEIDLRLFPSRNVQFFCGCNSDKIKSVIFMLGEKEAQQLISEQGHIEISCDFCNQNYVFDAIDTAALFHPKNIQRHEYLDPNVEIVKEIKPSRKF